MNIYLLIFIVVGDERHCGLSSNAFDIQALDREIQFLDVDSIPTPMYILWEHFIAIHDEDISVNAVWKSFIILIALLQLLLCHLQMYHVDSTVVNINLLLRDHMTGNNTLA